MSLGRESRVRCRIPCEVIHGRRRTNALVVDLSKSGIGLESSLEVEEGDDLQICLFPQRRSGSIVLKAIAWNRRRRVNSRGRGAVQVLGCMLSDPPPAFLRLLDKLGGEDLGAYRLARRQRTTPATAESGPTGRSHPLDPKWPETELMPVVAPPAKSPNPQERSDPDSLTVVQEAPVDPSLPRPKYPLPPTKLDPEEPLSLFRVRVKQVNGPRSRRLETYAQSLQDLERRVAQDLGEEWEILEIKALDDE